MEARLPLAPKGYSVRSVAGKGDFGSLPPLVTRPVLKGTYPQHRDSLRGLGCVANSVGLPCNTCTDRLVNAGV